MNIQMCVVASRKSASRRKLRRIRIGDIKIREPLFATLREKFLAQIIGEVPIMIAMTSRMWRLDEALEFGVIGVNTGIISYEGAPFDGMKASGVDREGSGQAIESSPNRDTSAWAM